MLLVACGGQPAPAHPTSAGDHAATPPVVAAAAPSERECDALFAHVSAIAAADQRAASPATPATDADVATEQAAEHGSAMAACRAMPRAAYTCAIAAPSSEQLVACDQATRSSSTSNSSVAPGGITPPAPRSP